MEEKKFIEIRKEEFAIKDFVKKNFGKGKISNVRIEYTPVGEKIVVSTHRPGIVIGRSGETIANLTETLKKRFKMENPHIDIEEIKNIDFDAQLIADEIALGLERFGSIRFKNIGYKMLTRIQKAGALGCELRLSGKLPSERAKSWRFAFGYLKKTGGAAEVVDRAESIAQTPKGVIGIKVSILSPKAKILDKVEINEELMQQIKRNNVEKPEEKIKKKKVKKVN
jgi:small subunit ribosomal protein S3